MLGEYAAHQAAQQRHLAVPGRARMDDQQPIPRADIIQKGRLDFIGDPVPLVGCRDIVRFGQDDQGIAVHSFGRPFAGVSIQSNTKPQSRSAPRPARAVRAGWW